MAAIRLNRVTKAYAPGEAPAVDDVTLSVSDGEFFVLLGPSGCGKSTLLRLIGGLEEADAGEIWLADRLSNYDPPGRRNVAMVFQSYALYPHLTARRNIAFPLKMHKVAKDQQHERTDQVATMLGISDLLDRRVGELSGGQRQRVAVGRAVVRRPEALLMDEPLSNLDALLRVQTREQLVSLHREIAVTVVYVTHDQVEAMTMGDRIGVMKDGCLVQVGSPKDIYHEPADRFVAGFMGSPPMNLIDGELSTATDEPTFVCEALRVPLVSDGFRTDTDWRLSDRASVALGARPESIVARADDGGIWTVALVEDLGADQTMLLRSGGMSVRVRSDRSLPEGSSASLDFAAESVHLFDETGRAVYRLSGALAHSA